MSDIALSIGGTDLVSAFAEAGHELILKVPSGRDPVEAELSTSNLPGSAGTRIVDESLPAREIGVGYVLVSDNASERREAGRLLGRLIRGGIQNIEFSDQDGYYYRGVPRNAEGSSMPRWGRGELTIYCPQPWLYGDQRTVSPSGGTVTIESNEFVEPVILWELSETVGAAWIEVDGRRLTIDTGISSGQQIRIDCARKETRIGGVLNVENIHGVYPQVRDGSTVETSPGGSLQFQYQERWI